MASTRIQVDLANPDHVALLKDLAAQLEWEVKSEASCSSPPDILVTTPERLHGHEYLKSRCDLHPQILLLADPEEVDIRHLLGIKVLGFLNPALDPDLVKGILEEAHKKSQELRDEFFTLHQIEERYEEATVLLDLALELEPELSIQEVLERIVEHIADDLGYAIVSIMLLDDDEDLTIRAAKGLGQHIVDSTRMELGKGVSGIVAQSGEPLLVKDVEKDERFSKVQSHGRYTTKSLICVPLKVGHRVIGVLNANNKKRTGPLNEYDLRILSVFAAHISISIERSRLYHNLERKAQELEEAYGKLQVIDQIKSDFIVNVAHEYRTPVTIILGYLELLKNSLSENLHLEKVSVALDAAGRLSNLIEDSTDLLRLDTDSTPFLFKETQVHYFLEESVRRQWSRFGHKGVDLSLELPDHLPSVWVDEDKITRAFDKLLDNALKFTPPGGYVLVKADNYGAGGILISVEDSGAGVPPENARWIFERFEQGGDIMTEKPEGTGLGLPIAKAIVIKHRGTIGVDSRYEQGCRVIVTLPSLASWGKKESPESSVQNPEGEGESPEARAQSPEKNSVED